MLNMKKSLLLLLLMAFFLMPSYVSAQVYVSDYTFSTYPGSFTSIASTGTELTDAQGDDVSASLSLPFTFPFGQDSCSQVMVSSNGQIGIGSADPAYNGFEVHGTDMSIISPLAMDYNLDSKAAFDKAYELFGIQVDNTSNQGKVEGGLSEMDGQKQAKTGQYTHTHTDVYTHKGPRPSKGESVK